MSEQTAPEPEVIIVSGDAFNERMETGPLASCEVLISERRLAARREYLDALVQDVKWTLRDFEEQQEKMLKATESDTWKARFGQ